MALIETAGVGFTVIVKDCGVPVHILGDVPVEGVTVMVAVMGAFVVFVAGKEEIILPVPELANPVAVLLFVQLKAVAPVPLKLIAVVACPAQSIWSAGSFTVGMGVTVTATELVAVQPPIPVTVTM